MEGYEMADDKNEVYDLVDRAARLSPGEQLYLVEKILAGLRYAHFTDHKAMKQELAAVEEWHTAQQHLKGLSEEAKREAG
jgi:hypothetical protein